MLCTRPGPAIEREVVILATAHDTLTWEHILEPPVKKRISTRTIIYPEEAEGVKPVFLVRDVRADSREIH
jgi:hypothetical protein